MSGISRRAALRLAAYGLAAAMTGSYTVFIERNIVLVNRYQIQLAKLPSAFHGFTIAHLSDLHFGSLVSSDFIRKVVERTNALRTDVICCTGDYVHAMNTTAELDQVWPILMKLQARHGVLSVLGNHDHWADTDRSLYWLERSGQNLRHTCKAIELGKERLILGGAGDLWEDRLLIDQVFANSAENDCRILLSHNPDAMDTPFKTSFELMMSGHTHGGQVRLPFYGPSVLPVENKRYSSGLIDTPKTKLFISRGIGWAIYPVRFNCYPEIAVLELVRA
ncbi:MAG: metallophosphoesterase [Candidatus Electronema sp. V4]|uniref:metallophosphoesterase n=1 Tax=Candidatus Electronema sp. V4 TaxID=3454756 RepID=UPI0040555252